MYSSKAGIVCLDVSIRSPEHAEVITASNSDEYFRKAQERLDAWSRQLAPHEMREVTVEIEWEGGVAFSAEMNLLHPSRGMPLEERDIAANVVHYLEYCTHRREVWPPAVAMWEAFAACRPRDLVVDPLAEAKAMDFRSEQTREWAQHILDTCWLPEAANA